MKRTPLRWFLNTRLRQLAGRIKNRTIIELGTGANTYKSYFRDNFFVRSDIALRSRIDLFADAMHLPFKTSKADYVLCLNILEHIPNPQRAIEEANNVLKPGGSLVAYTPFLFPVHDKVDYWRFTEEAYKLMLKDYKKIEVHKIGFWKFVLGYFVIATKN